MVCAVEQNALDQTGSVSECSSCYISPRSAILSSYRNIDWHNGTYHFGNVKLASASDVEFCICTAVKGQCFIPMDCFVIIFIDIIIQLFLFIC